MPTQRAQISAIDHSIWAQKGLLGASGSIILVFLVLMAATAAAKTVTVENYLKHKNAFRNFHVSWLDGVFSGLKAANAELQRDNKAPLICPPADFSLTQGQVSAFFDKFIVSRKSKVQSSDFIGVLLLKALKESYPCPG